ncbi:hypothetical protein F5Y17DRAFT_244789 [Xylariaceae sp. FL0594]|nr:hypothetical protein F5Y17DRAFT_244789 [Xylariaceae sp. FL0594]
MDQPAAKKRRLAPKGEPNHSYGAQPSPAAAAPIGAYNHESTHQIPQPQPAQPAQPAQLYPPQDTQPSDRPIFECFARHLQDAAMLIGEQGQRLRYRKVSVLLLRWEDDAATELDLVALEQVLRERYGYSTERWNIPTISNPYLRLGIRMASFLEQAGPDHLLVIHYAGYSFNGPDKQLYWASNAKEDAPKLRWSGFRCLIEETPSDVLLLLDCGVVKEEIERGSSSTKQVIAAGTVDHYVRESGARSFTANLTEAFLQLDNNRLFTTEQLFKEAARLREQDLAQSPKLANGISIETTQGPDKSPLQYSIASGKINAIGLRPLNPATAPAAWAQGTQREAGSETSSEGDVAKTDSNPVLDEKRVLVCTTYVGEPSSDLSSFFDWLKNSPGGIASQFQVEAMFLGPPTVMLISMTKDAWDYARPEEVCYCLGQISSHNIIPFYKRLISTIPSEKVLAKDIEDGRMLLGARELVGAAPNVHRHLLPETPSRSENGERTHLPSVSHSGPHSSILYHGIRPGTAVSRRDDVEETAEMQEAAEQLKALSHIRHLSGDLSAAQLGPSPSMRAAEARNDRFMDEATLRAMVHADNIDGSRYPVVSITSSSRSRQGRRSISKPIPKQETRCHHCDHVPFKDSSTLRKHIAAIHTRPFPCAFSFAGCPSTFGSKNEWKRHIASQHLCLQYYRCSSCGQSSAEGKGNEFNRKDLFTQHLRRMHAPFAIKKALTTNDSKLQAEWETRVKELQQTCLVTRRRPPQRSACPKANCNSVFEGPTSWDEWTEHVGRHMEKGEAEHLGVDPLLAEWAFKEGIIERKEDGDYRLCNGNGSSGAEKETNHSTELHSDGTKRDADDRTIVAASTIVEKMDVD